MIFKIIPASEKDCEDICKLREYSRSFIHDYTLYSLENCKNWIVNLPRTSERLSVFLEVARKKEFIGLFRIDKIDYNNRNCCVGLDIMPEYRGVGFGKLIYKQVFSELFFNKNFNLVWLEVLKTNTHAINLYMKLGFITEGTLRERVFRDNKYQDCFIMSLKREEWVLLNEK